jgi:hypothetical protein
MPASDFALEAIASGIGFFLRPSSLRSSPGLPDVHRVATIRHDAQKQESPVASLCGDNGGFFRPH